MRPAAASIGTRLPGDGRPIARTKRDKSSECGPNVCSNAPVSKRRRWNTANVDEGRELMDLKRCRLLRVLRFEARFERRFAGPTLKCVRECARLVITEKPSNLRYR